MSVIDLGGVDPGVWRGLLDQANSGDLTLDPEVGAALNTACENYLLKLDDIYTKTFDVREVQGFGGFDSSADLQSKFRDKATGTTQSIDAVIQEHIETVKLIQQVVAKSIANLTETDQNTGQQVTKTGQDIPQG
ncbi:hypothetical protein IU438_15550 [Nocardia cyriacigeorgica]|nr:hypothetical protein [Nocardia cyriacigeorgica]MBF6325590.1 hypothetical protein [Nocardia cyriacigeorgica]MBF6397204.1 hypothetical protein [Nocardia cyriacigeorgica]MBF6403138.1 hypothetical protein [Nocardia cyriacigeorgica]MBF6499275.1 hypothetical protein [Nocardia cyriacigeorgica]